MPNSSDTPNAHKPTQPPALLQLIGDRIAQEGPITFASFMRMALYEPGLGYYVNGTTPVGWSGDFFTSTDISPFFAHCMGRQLQSLWQQANRPKLFIVLEQGAGRGDLAREICAWAEREAPAFHAALDYRITDINVGHNALMPYVIPLNIPLAIISNELIDAFPVHIVEKQDDQLNEVYVTIEQGRLREVLAEPSTPTIAAYLDTYNVPWQSFPNGWRAEINLDALSWIEQTARLLHALAPSSPTGPATRKLSSNSRRWLLAIDYGEKARELFTRDRRRGTLACYYQHQFNERPLLYPGQQDITAHVNFSALIRAGRQHGLRLHAYTTQAAWLQAQGIETELAQIRARDFSIIDTDRASNQGQSALLQWYNLKQRVSALTDPHGMGNFKVLMMKM
jgi:SAM-dependent MidA family methyltransferase